MTRKEWFILLVAGYLGAEVVWFLIVGNSFDWGEFSTMIAAGLIACFTFPRNAQ